jgi:hypothetical protein
VRRPLGPADLDDPLAVLGQEPGQAGAVAARPLDRPAATAGNLRVGEVQQPPVAGGIGADGAVGEHATQAGDGGGGERVAVGVDADDAVDRLCQHGRAVVLLGGAAVSWCRPGRSHRAAEL